MTCMPSSSMSGRPECKHVLGKAAPGTGAAQGSARPMAQRWYDTCDGPKVGMPSRLNRMFV